jgi:DNA-binding MarR family transcriptional regulator
MGKRQKLVAMAQEIDQHLSAVRNLVRKPLEAEFARGQLTGPQRSVMQALVHSDGMSLKELSRQVGLAHSTVSGIVDRLEGRGLVKRNIDEADRRLSVIVVSQEVQNFMRNTLPALMIHPLVEALSRAKPGDRTIILEGLRTLHAILATGNTSGS